MATPAITAPPATSATPVDILGPHTFQAQPSTTPLNIRDVFKNIQIQYPSTKDKKTHIISLGAHFDNIFDPNKYGNIAHRLSSTATGLLLCPPIPQILSHTAGSLEVAEQRKDHDKLYVEWLRLVKPYVTENRLYNELYRTLRPEIGTLFQSCNTSDYCGILMESLEKSELETIKNGNFLEDWKSLGRLKGIAIDSLDFTKDGVSGDDIRSLISNLKGVRDDIVNNALFKKRFTLKQSVDKILQYIRQEQQVATNVHRSFDDHVTKLTDIQINNAFKICTVKGFGREVDFLLVLPVYKIVAQVEVKDCIEKKVPIRMKEAQEQLRVMKDWLQDVHGHTFSNGWRYVAVAAFPSLPSSASAKLDPSSYPFLITKDTLDLGLAKWYQDFLTECGFTHTPGLEPEEAAYEDYTEFTRYTVGLARLNHDLRMSIGRSGRVLQEALHGPGACAISAGYNPAGDKFPHPSSPLHPATVRIKDGDLERNLLYVMLWSDDQEFFKKCDVQFVIMKSDFGTAKTMIQKSKAESMATPEGKSKAVSAPESPLSKELPQLVSIQRVSHCMLCKTNKFSSFTQKPWLQTLLQFLHFQHKPHHCRQCGIVVCASCSSNTCKLPLIPSSGSVRVCDGCYGKLTLNTQATTSNSASTSNAATASNSAGASTSATVSTGSASSSASTSATASTLPTQTAGSAVYYLSLAACDYTEPDVSSLPGSAIPLSYPSMFDLASKRQLQHTHVQCLHAPDLQSLYLSHHPGASPDKTMYELLTWFIKENPGAHYFIDELGVRTPLVDVDNDGNPITDFTELTRFVACLDNLMSICRGKLWLVLRKTGLWQTVHGEKLQTLLTELQVKHTICVPELKVNYRSTAAISLAAVSPSSPDYDTTSEAAPCDTVQGHPVHVLQVGYDNNIPSPALLRQGLDTAFSQCLNIDPLKDGSQDCVVVICEDEYRDVTIKALGDKKARVVTHFPDQNDTAAVSQFLDRPEGVLITNIKAYSGMEAQTVLYVGQYGDDYRDCLLRAVSRLAVITFSSTQYDSFVCVGCFAAAKFT